LSSSCGFANDTSSAHGLFAEKSGVFQIACSAGGKATAGSQKIAPHNVAKSKLALFRVDMMLRRLVKLSVKRWVREI
jgi:hypothetical protein